MHSKTLISITLWLALFGAADAIAAAGDESESAAAGSERPEHQARPLPQDTFKPSEEISEDFPVPFPVDI